MRATLRTKSVLVGIECGMSAGFTPATFDNFRLYRKTRCVGRKRPFWARDIFGRAKVVEKTVRRWFGGGWGRRRGPDFLKAAAKNRVTLRDAGVRQRVPKTAAIVPEMSVVRLLACIWAPWQLHLKGPCSVKRSGQIRDAAFVDD